LAMGWEGPMSQLVIWIGLWDLVVTGPAAYAAHIGERTPGGTFVWFSETILFVAFAWLSQFLAIFTADYNWDKFKPKDDAKYQDKVNSELLNGRLAMIAVGGIATQSIITGHGFPYV
jgi:Chlorophyll A-B binding protein